MIRTFQAWVKHSLMGKCTDEFFKAMDKEIASLEEMGTWEIIDRVSIGTDVKVTPGVGKPHRTCVHPHRIP